MVEMRLLIDDELICLNFEVFEVVVVEFFGFVFFEI